MKKTKKTKQNKIASIELILLRQQYIFE